MRASVAAFCSLTRPTRREIAQLDQLAMPLYDRVSAETRRYVAAALSDSPYAPPELARRLADEPVEIAAPLLVRSPVLADVDLVGLIARRGVEHARVIARRGNLNPAIGRLVAALVAASGAVPEEAPAELSDPPSPAEEGAADAPDRIDAAARPVPAPASAGDGAGAARLALRAIMGGQSAAPASGSSFSEAYRAARGADAIHASLKSALFSGRSAEFRAALASAVGIDERVARRISGARDLDDLVAAFRHLGLTEEQAFLLVCAASPGRFADLDAIRDFVDRYRALGRRAARLRLATLRAEGAGTATGPSPDAKSA